MQLRNISEVCQKSEHSSRSLFSGKQEFALASYFSSSSFTVCGWPFTMLRAKQTPAGSAEASKTNGCDPPGKTRSASICTSLPVMSYTVSVSRSQDDVDEVASLAVATARVCPVLSLRCSGDGLSPSPLFFLPQSQPDRQYLIIIMVGDPEVPQGRRQKEE